MTHSIDHEFEITDPQNRKIAYSYMDILELSGRHKFADEVPQHFVAIFTKPDWIYIDKTNDVHCYTKTIDEKECRVTTFEKMRNKRKRFCINSWAVEKDTGHVKEL